VQFIDMNSKTLSIVTPVPQEILQRVNTILKGNIDTPYLTVTVTKKDENFIFRCLEVRTFCQILLLEKQLVHSQ
jgi:hypothetical protein